MTSESSRRFTDREVALVLRKASELDEAQGSAGAAGLSLAQLEEIAAEVGIAPEVVRRAVSELDRSGPRGLLSGGPLSHQAIRAVPGELDREALARLIQHVDGSSDQVGQVTEALGGIQWTARDRFRTTQVSLTPSGGETRVRVVERATSRLRRVVHFMPTMVGLALVGGTVGALEPTSGMVAALMAGGAALGAAVGRFVWGRLSAGSAARVERLASGLAQEAEAASPRDEEG